MYDLNDIHRAFKLPKKRQPSQWRGRERTFFEQNANLHSGNYKGKSQTLASEDTLYGYAMWCDMDFYGLVIAAFKGVVHRDYDEAAKAADIIVSDHEARATELYVKGQRGGYAMRQAIAELNGSQSGPCGPRLQGRPALLCGEGRSGGPGLQ